MEWKGKLFFWRICGKWRSCTYDGLINQHGDIVFETSFLYTESTLDAVNNSLDYANIIEPNINSKLREIGKCIVHEFGMRERFFHIEFFRIPDGEYIALEYNNRIAGGTCVDLYNYSYNISLYDMYADVVLDNEVSRNSTNRYTISLSRRNKYQYVYSLDNIRNKYTQELRMISYVPEVFSASMGDIIIIISVDNKNQINEVMDYVQKKM